MYIFALILGCAFPVFDFVESHRKAYEQIDLMPLNIRGWLRYEHIFEPLLKQRPFNTVIEVGAYLGNWTTFIAELLPEESRFFAVDHWEGSEEHLTLGAVEAPYIPTLYTQFLSNIIHKNLMHKVIPVKMESVDAAKKFKELNIKGDLIYIDAGHDYISVLQDLYAWFPLLEEGGVFCGDDWHYGGVQMAVKQFAEKKGYEIFVDGNFWRLKTEG